mmetsp:Transcript_97584/g.252347  ORF Transcript_97584/g.252347 Transcript_97584/m.252347 type:complete len:239 (+) Transcript_97584:2-718(+)
MQRAVWKRGQPRWGVPQRTQTTSARRATGQSTRLRAKKRRSLGDELQSRSTKPRMMGSVRTGGRPVEMARQRRQRTDPEHETRRRNKRTGTGTRRQMRRRKSHLLLAVGIMLDHMLQMLSPPGREGFKTKVQRQRRSEGKTSHKPGISQITVTKRRSKCKMLPRHWRVASISSSGSSSSPCVERSSGRSRMKRGTGRLLVMKRSSTRARPQSKERRQCRSQAGIRQGSQEHTRKNSFK